jgi:hypothetical protein
MHLYLTKDFSPKSVMFDEGVQYVGTYKVL